MTAAGDRRSLVRDHPFLAAYLGALAAVWAFSIATWTVRGGQPPALHPVAQGLQYLLVVVAATLAALQLRIGGRETRADAEFRMFDRAWSIRDDIAGQAFWTALWVGAAAMVLNIVILALADLLVAGGSAGVRTYFEWIGSGIAAGAVLGMFSALLAAIVAWLIRLVRHA